jgi:hypothetical protein
MESAEPGSGLYQKRLKNQFNESTEIQEKLTIGGALPSHFLESHRNTLSPQ